MKRIIEKTDDGSTTLFVPELNEHYHSTKGARTESQHIFINMGLKASTATHPSHSGNRFRNRSERLAHPRRSRKKREECILYRSGTLSPEWQLVEQLGYISANEQLMTGDNQCPAHELFKQLHTSPWEEDVPITPHFTLRKVQKDFNKLETETEGWKADVIYFDAFAPEKQPEMWSQELFNRLYVLLNNSGILTTYCAKGVVRRMLQAAGFIVERLPGPPGGKREILRPGNKNKNLKTKTRISKTR